MELYSQTAQDENGDIVNGASVSVTESASGNPATIYDKDGGALSNPFLTGYDRSKGEVEFAAANNLYDITVTGNPGATKTDQTLFDPAAGDLAIYDTVALMKAELLQAGATVMTRGYYAAGDGGGATYLIVAPQAFDGYGDHELANGNIAVLQVDGRLRAAQYGAKKEGVDVTAHLTAAQIAEKAVEFSSGIYLVNDLKMQQHGQRFICDSQYGVVFKLVDGANACVIDTNSKSGLVLENFRVDGNRTNNSSGGGIAVNNTYYSRFNNVDVRESSDTSWALVNSNDNAFDVCQTHDTDDNGWDIDATSQHNTFNASGSEDFVGIGFNVAGIGNVFNAPWVENRAGLVTDVGIYLNNRDNILNAPEVRGAGAAALAVGIKLGSYSEKSLVVNPHFSDCTIDIETTGTNQYRTLLGVNDAQITNTGGDTTTLIRSGNKSYSNAKMESAAPVQEYESTNGVSGVRFNLVGTASSNGMRWQFNGSTKAEMTPSFHYHPGGDDAQDIGGSTNRWRNANFSGYISIGDGITPPAPVAGSAFIYVDTDGDLKIKFGDGTVKTIVSD